MERLNEDAFKINGDNKDSPTQWSDFKNKLINKCGVEEFMTPVGTPILWNINQTVQEKQKQGIRNCLDALVEVCGTGVVRDHVRDVQENRIIVGGIALNLTEPVEKMRHLMGFFNHITAPNDILDGENMEEIKNLRFSSTGTTNVYSDVVRFFETFDNLNKELQDHTKLTEYAKKKKMGDAFMTVHNTMSVAITAMPLTSALFTYADFKARVKEIAQNINIMRPQDTMSSNSTSAQGSHERMITMTESEYRNMTEQKPHSSRDYYSSNSSNPYEQGRRRSDTQGTYGPYSSSSRHRSSSRGRSPGRRRDDRGRSPEAQPYRNRSRSRDRSSSRGNQRSSNSTHYVCDNRNRHENRRSYGEEKRTQGWR